MSPCPSRSEGFNPCFNGSVERGKAALELLNEAGENVSILVLMEVLREARPAANDRGPIGLFQSLF